ncbi:MAG: GHKL domain-containing protein [Cytophagia bacterium]|nr:GHKL domain-containing protein [Cytophagia bacterium]
MSFTGKAKIFILYLSWWLLWMVVQSIVLFQTGFVWETAIQDAIITQLMIALAGYAINTSMHSYQPSAKHAVYVLIWSLALTFLSLALQRWLLIQTIGDDADYLQFLEGSLTVRGGFTLLMIMLVAVLTWFWVYFNDKQESEKRKQDNEKLAREAELSSLRLQLQPHFLFNSLNSINALVVADPERARTMIHQLSDFLRGTIRKDTSLVNLDEELDHLQLYLEIEKVRFGHRLKTNIEKSEACKDTKVPLLLLQPVVENAIKFGLYDTIGETIISIEASMQGKDLLIDVKNPVDEETAQAKKGTGFGLTAVQRRLYLLYAQNNLVQTKQEEGIFTTSLRIPQL